MFGRQGVETRHYVYVDNLGCISRRRPNAEDCVLRWDADFEEDGLLLHKSEVHGIVEALGIGLDGRARKATLTVKRSECMRQAIRGLLRLRRP